MTSMPWSRASSVVELMTPLIPGAGPPPTTRAILLKPSPFAMPIPHSWRVGAFARWRYAESRGGDRAGLRNPLNAAQYENTAQKYPYALEGAGTREISRRF